MSRSPLLGLLALALQGSCLATAPARPRSLGLGVSALPNLGLAGTLGLPLGGDERADVDLELRVLHQFLDDEDFVDDGNPGAGDLSGLQFGARVRTDPGGSRHAVFRGGLHAFEARGQPNLVDSAGTYAGVYLSVGFESDLGAHWSLGPELSLLPTFGEDEFSLLPQLTLGLSYRPGPRTRPRPR